MQFHRRWSMEGPFCLSSLESWRTNCDCLTLTPTQELLLEQGVAVIVNVPLSAMQALAVCIGAEVRGPARARDDGGAPGFRGPHMPRLGLTDRAMSWPSPPGGAGCGVCRGQERGILQELRGFGLERL